MKQIPDNVEIKLTYNVRGQLCASWFFIYKSIPYGLTHIGITESLDRVLEEIEAVYREAKDNYG